MYRFASSTAAALACLALASCAKPTPPPANIQEADFNVSIPLNEVMAHAMSPAAFQFWSGWGTKTNAQGTFDLAPKNDAEWKYVEDGAVGVVMATNVIRLPAYARPPLAEWKAAADKLDAVAMRAKDAAERRDKVALGVIGGELDLACEACHQRFIPNYQN